MVNIHISKAITLLSDRDKPDYENSIKESISAVEALCEVITGVKGKEATLSKLLKKAGRRRGGNSLGYEIPLKKQNLCWYPVVLLSIT